MVVRNKRGAFADRIGIVFAAAALGKMGTKDTARPHELLQGFNEFRRGFTRDGKARPDYPLRDVLCIAPMRIIRTVTIKRIIVC